MDSANKPVRYTVYCHIHIESGRRYVGLTKLTMMKRWNQHVYNAESKKGRGALTSGRPFAPMARTRSRTKFCGGAPVLRKRMRTRSTSLICSAHKTLPLDSIWRRAALTRRIHSRILGTGQSIGKPQRSALASCGKTQSFGSKMWLGLMP